jgi:hypothetical protein
MTELLPRLCRHAVVVAVVLGLFAAAIPKVGFASSPRKFSFTGAGTNVVTIQTGELRERWTGHANPFGKITAHVTGRIKLPTPTSLVVHSRMVINDPSGDELIGTCSGKGIPPTPKGSEDWSCVATGGTGKFKHSHGRWTLHIVIHRISNDNGVQKNRFTEKGAGRISWNAGG